VIPSYRLLALVTAKDAWGTRQPDPGPDDEVPHQHEAFQIMCRGPLVLARQASPVLEVLTKYEDEIHTNLSADIVDIRVGLMMGMAATTGPALTSWLKRLPLRRLIAMQILGAAIAAYGNQGIFLQGPSYNRQRDGRVPLRVPVM
jgi:hypothetical protein